MRLLLVILFIFCSFSFGDNKKQLKKLQKLELEAEIKKLEIKKERTNHLIQAKFEKSAKKAAAHLDRAEILKRQEKELGKKIDDIENTIYLYKDIISIEKNIKQKKETLKEED